MIEYYSMSVIFAMALVIEGMVAGRLFLHRNRYLGLSSFMRWWAVGSVFSISLINVLALLRLHHNYTTTGIDPGNYVQAAMAAGTLSLMLWVWIFHLDKWGRRQ